MNWPWQRKDEELDAEIQSHLAMAQGDRMERGESAEQARAAVRREFGNVGLVKEVTRQMWGWAALDRLIQDLRFGARMLRKHPGFTLIAALTLALGIGANLTIFSFVDAFFLRPLPARDPGALVNVEVSRHGRPAPDFSYPSYAHYRDHSQSFAALAAHYSTAPLQLALDGDARVANGAVVSANYFSLLGIQPALGRFFLPEEDAVPDRNPVVIISHRLWRERFGGDAAAVGKELRLNGTACRIVGVAPADFPGALAGFRNEFWLPTMMLRLGFRGCDALVQPSCNPLALLGRLAPGRALHAAQAELNLLTQQLAANSPDQQGRVIGVSQDAQLRSAVEGPLPLLYLPHSQGDANASNDVRLLVRVAGDPQQMLPQLRRAVMAVDANVPISEDAPLTQQVNAIYKPVLLTSAVLTWAGALAFFLSMLGLYGALAYAVGERTREIGIRMALGAERRAVLRMVIAQGLRLALIGVVIGLPAAYVTTRWMKSLLYGVSATDPLTYAAIALLLLAVAAAACWLPARRATQVDPLIALRCD